MATNLTPPGDAVSRAPFFSQPETAILRPLFSPPFETGSPSWFQAIYDANRPVFLSTGATVSIFHRRCPRGPSRTLPPLRNLAVVKPGIGLFAGLMEFSTFLEIYGINLRKCIRA